MNPEFLLFRVSMQGCNKEGIVKGMCTCWWLFKHILCPPLQWKFQNFGEKVGYCPPPPEPSGTPQFGQTTTKLSFETVLKHRIRGLYEIGQSSPGVYGRGTSNTPHRFNNQNRRLYESLTNNCRPTNISEPHVPFSWAPTQTYPSIGSMAVPWKHIVETDDRDRETEARFECVFV